MASLLTGVLTIAFVATTGMIVWRQINTKLTHTELLQRHGKSLAGLYVLDFVLLLALCYVQGTLVGIAPMAVTIVICVPITVVLRRKNSEMAEMQLFKKYWFVWIGFLILILATGGWSIVMICKTFLGKLGN